MSGPEPQPCFDAQLKLDDGVSNIHLQRKYTSRAGLMRGKQPLLAAFAFRVGGFFLPPVITYRRTAYWEVVLPKLAGMAGAAHTRGPLNDTGGAFPDLSFGSGMVSFQFFFCFSACFTLC